MEGAFEPAAAMRMTSSVWVILSRNLAFVQRREELLLSCSVVKNKYSFKKQSTQASWLGNVI